MNKKKYNLKRKKNIFKFQMTKNPVYAAPPAPWPSTYAKCARAAFGFVAVARTCCIIMRRMRVNNIAQQQKQKQKQKP